MSQQLDTTIFSNANTVRINGLTPCLNYMHNKIKVITHTSSNSLCMHMVRFSADIYKKVLTQELYTDQCLTCQMGAGLFKATLNPSQENK